MDNRYGVSVKASHVSAFRQHLHEVLKADGFEEHTLYGGAELIHLCYFHKDERTVSMTITNEPMEKVRVELHSETLPLKEMVLKTVYHMITELSESFLEPLIPLQAIEDIKRTIQGAILART